jgi:hypothetical protein
VSVGSYGLSFAAEAFYAEGINGYQAV